MIDIRSAVIASVAVLLVIGISYKIWTWRSSINGDPEQRERTQEELRLEASGAGRADRVGFTSRVRAQPRMTLIFFGCVVAVFLILLVAAYQVAKTGSPSEMAYTEQIEFALTSTIFIGAGVWFKMHQDRKAGELNITYEGQNTNATETIYYDRDLVQPLFDDEGDKDAILVPVFKQNRIFGVFWTPKLVADEPDIRDVDKNLPEDQVTYEVALDESTTWRQDERKINVRAKDTKPVKHADRRATYEFQPSDRKSDAEIQDIQDENEQLREQIKHERRMNGIHTMELEDMEEALENRDHGSLDHLDDSFELMMELMESMNPGGNRRDSRRDGAGSPRKNGDQAASPAGNSSE